MAKEEVRIEEVYRRWQNLSLFADKLATAPIQRFEGLSLLTGFLSLLLIFITEISLISRGLLPNFSNTLSPYYILPSLLSMPAQGWYVHTLLSSRTPSDRAIPLWLKIGRCLLGSVPFLSPVIITGWMELLKQRPAWLFSITGKQPYLDLKKSPPQISKKRLPSIITVLFLFETILNSVLFYIWVLWLARTDSLGANRPAVLVTICFVLHIVLLLSFNLKPQTSERFSLKSSRLLYFLPFPFSIIILLKQRTNTTVMAGSIGSHTQYPLLLRIRNELHAAWIREPWFRQWRKPLGVASKRNHRGKVEVHLASFYRQKISLLLLEGNILAQLLSSLGRRFPSLSSTVHATLLTATITGLTLSGIGLAMMTMLAFRRLLRISGLSPQVSASAFYLALAQVTFVGGIQSRLFWNEWRFYELIWLMIIGGSLLFVLWTFSRSCPEGDRSAKSTGFFFLVFCMLASRHEKIALLSLKILYLLSLLTPLWSLILFFFNSELGSSGHSPGGISSTVACHLGNVWRWLG